MKIVKLNEVTSMELLSIKPPTIKMQSGREESDSGVFNGVRIGGDFITMWCDPSLYAGLVGNLNPNRPSSGVYTELDIKSRLHYTGTEITRMDTSSDDTNVAVAIDIIPSIRYTKAMPSDYDKTAPEPLIIEKVAGGGLRATQKPYKMIPEDVYGVMDALREKYTNKKVKAGDGFTVPSRGNTPSFNVYVDSVASNRLTLDIIL